MNNNEEITALTKCDNTILADEIVTKLAEEGITASLHDELNDPAYGAYGANPGIEVSVFKKDLERSQRILKAINASRSEQLPWCPKCGSEKVIALSKTKSKRSKAFILIGSFLIILGCAGLWLPIFVEALASVRTYGLFISPFVILGGVLMVLPKQERQYYQCSVCGNKFSN